MFMITMARSFLQRRFEKHTNLVTIILVLGIYSWRHSIIDTENLFIALSIMETQTKESMQQELAELEADLDTALEKYRALIHGSELSRMQEEYLRTLIKYVCENGDIATVVLQQPPFNKFTTIFKNSPKSLIDYVKLISEVIAA